jgi:sensor histidine kinase YesM
MMAGMKRGTIKFFLKITVQATAFFVVFHTVLALLRHTHEPWQATVTTILIMATVTGLFLAGLATGAALRGLGGEELDPADIKWLATRQSTQVELPLSVLDSLELVEDVLRARRGVYSVTRDAGQQRVSAYTRAPRSIFGEVITVTLAPTGALAAATTRALIECGNVVRISLIDFGRSRAHVQSVVLALNQEVNNRLAAAKEASLTASLQAQLHQSRLSLLQAQVEPHFLYNTLAHLQLLIRSEPRAADLMAGDLIRYLRLSMPEFRAAGFTLGRELELVRAYLDIMKIRLRDRLEVRIEADEGAANFPFPPLLLHTLVENAIKHGIEPKPEGGSVSISVRHRFNGDERLVIGVADTGVGLQAGLEGSGVGLANLRERLDLLYPGSARFSIAANSPSGVVATLDIPCAEAAIA